MSSIVYLTFPEGTEVRRRDGETVTLPDIPLPVASDRARELVDAGEIPVAELVEGMLVAVGKEPEGRWQREYRKLLFTFEPNLEERLLAEGADLAQSGRVEEGLRRLEALLALVPTFSEGWYNLGLCRCDLAVQSEDAACQAAELQWALEAFTRSVEIAPTFADAYYQLGFVCRDLGVLCEARQAWRSFLRLAQDPDRIRQIEEILGDVDAVVEVEERLSEGSRLVLEGQFSEGLEALQKVLETQPEWADAVFLAGVAHRNLSQLDEAIRAFERCLELEPGRVEVENELGLCYLEVERFEEAEASFLRVLEVMPDDAGALCNLGLLHYSRGDRDEAERLIRRAHELEPEDETTQRCLELLDFDDEDPSN